MKESELSSLVAPLLSWYEANARILPWRETKDPYAIWLSEIMLQQTRVEAVKPYYARFLSILPTIQSLAECEEELLLKLWEGLGYYSRVKNMKKAAIQIMQEFGGVFPKNLSDIRKLPGIGEYTAGAIASIAFEQSTPAIDGNVIRVFSRLTASSEEATPAMKKRLTALFQSIYPTTQRGDFTQSLMELGAIICLPNGAPKCASCPLSSLCEAYQTNTQSFYPVLPKKPKRSIEHKTVLLFYTNQKIALLKQEKRGLLSGLYALPTQSGCLQEDALRLLLKKEQVPYQSIQAGPQKKHIFTHIEWRLSCYLIPVTEEFSPYLWASKQELLEEYPLPTAFRRFLPLIPILSPD